MFKRIVTVTLAIIIIIGLATACASNKQNSNNDVASNTAQGNNELEQKDSQNETSEEVNPYEEKLSFTVLSLDNTENFMEYPLVVEAKEKFNFDFEIQQVAWDNWDQTVRTLAATDSLPEVVTWYNLNYAEYLDWVEQGVLKALPDDLSKYPKLQEITENYDVFDYIRVDGKLYAFPKVINSNPFNSYDPYFIVYRRDWAAEMGKDFDPVQEMTWDEFIDYLEEVKAKDPAGLGDKLVAFDLVDGGESWIEFIRRTFNPGIYGFQKVDGKYVWTTNDESSLEGIKAIKQLYDNGLLARDSYTDKKGMGKERFFAGRSATYFSNFNVATLQEAIQNIHKTDANLEESDLGILAVTNPDGEYIVTQKSEWWAALAFSSKCRDEVMDRWLAVGNWLIEEEQVEKYAYGVPGEDWSKDENGNITLNWTAEDIAQGGPKDYIVDQRLFQKFFILEGMDVWLEGNPAYSEYVVKDLFETGVKTFEKNPNYTPTDYDLAYFSGPNKNEYMGFLSSEARNAVIQAVLSDNPEQVWKEFIEANAQKAELVVEELNAELGE